MVRNNGRRRHACGSTAYNPRPLLSSASQTENCATISGGQQPAASAPAVITSTASKPCNKSDPGAGCSARPGLQCCMPWWVPGGAYRAPVWPWPRALDGWKRFPTAARRVVDCRPRHPDGFTPHIETALRPVRFIARPSLLHCPHQPGVQIHRCVTASICLCGRAIVDGAGDRTRSVRLAFGALARNDVLAPGAAVISSADATARAAVGGRPC
jgi:hypothetical protein